MQTTVKYSIMALSVFCVLLAANIVSTSAYAERRMEDVTEELTYLGTDLSGREKEYSKRMNLVIHDIVSTHYEHMEENARKALKAADKQWGAEHINTEMAVAASALARANAINFYGGGSRAEARELVWRARIFPALYPEFPGSYYIEILADISEA